LKTTSCRYIRKTIEKDHKMFALVPATNSYMTDFAILETAAETMPVRPAFTTGGMEAVFNAL